MEAIQESMAAIEQPLTEESAAVLNGFKSRIFPMTETRTSGNISSPPLEFDHLDFYTLPYRVIDTEAFIADPAPENLEKCIHPAEDRYFYFGKKDGNIIVQLTGIRQPNGQWWPGPIAADADYFKRFASWLGSELMQADKRKYYILNTGVLDYIVLHQDGEPVFIDFTGRFKMDKKKFADLVLYNYNNAASYREWLKENEPVKIDKQ
jgi:hypothetical protein